MIDKQILITNIISHLTTELKKAQLAAEQARLAAIDDESVAETQYDTLAIEASYLAEGQSRRVQEFQQAIDAFKTLQPTDYSADKPLAMAALVQLGHDSDGQHWFFIGPAAGGYRTQVAGQHITVVTKQSPMGQALVGKCLGDEVAIPLGPTTLSDEIVQVQ